MVREIEIGRARQVRCAGVVDEYADELGWIVERLRSDIPIGRGIASRAQWPRTVVGSGESETPARLTTDGDGITVWEGGTSLVGSP